MARFSTIRELAEQLGDEEPLPPPSKPLSEGALAEVAEAMRLLSSAGRRIDQAQGALEQCRVNFDARPFRRVQECLDEAWQALQPALCAHVEALDAKGARNA